MLQKVFLQFYFQGDPVMKTTDFHIYAAVMTDFSCVFTVALKSSIFNIKNFTQVGPQPD